MTLKSMRYFLAAIRGGSIASASAELNIAASAISTAIDQIESEFQMKLITRHPSRGITPTAVGKRLVSKFNSLLEDYNSLLEEGAEMKQALTGLLKVGYYAPIAPAFLPTIIKPMLANNSGLRVHLEECDNDRAQMGLLDGSFDVIVFASDSAFPTVEYDVLIDTPAYCLASVNHRFATRKSIHLTDLRNEPMIFLNRPMASAYYRGLLDSLGIKPDIVAFANSTEMVRSLVGAGLGCAILNVLPSTNRSYAGEGLVAVPISGNLQPISFAIGYTKSNPRRVVRRFVDAFHEYFDSDLGKKHIVTQETRRLNNPKIVDRLG